MMVSVLVGCRKFFWGPTSIQWVATGAEEAPEEQTSARVSLLRVEIENETSQGIF